MKDEVKVSDSQNKVTRSAIWVGSRVETSDPFRTRVHEVMNDKAKVSDSRQPELGHKVSDLGRVTGRDF